MLAERPTGASSNDNPGVPRWQSVDPAAAAGCSVCKKRKKILYCQMDVLIRWHCVLKAKLSYFKHLITFNIKLICRHGALTCRHRVWADENRGHTGVVYTLPSPPPCPLALLPYRKAKVHKHTCLPRLNPKQILRLWEVQEFHRFSMKFRLKNQCDADLKGSFISG